MTSELPQPQELPPPRSGWRSPPTSRPGRWARTMLFVLLGIYVLASVLTGVFGRREPGSTVDGVMQAAGPVIGIALVLAGLAALVFGLRALISHRDRGIVVWLAVAFGALAMLFLVAELVLPH